MDQSRKIGNVTGNTFGQNTNILGDNVNQTLIQSTEFENAYKDLLDEIKKNNHDTNRDQTETNAELLKSAIESGDKPKSEKFLRFLVGTLGVVQPLITIAQIAGLPIPNIPTT